MKNLIIPTIILLILTACQSSNHSPTKKQANRTSTVRSPAQVEIAESFSEQSRDKCNYEHGYFFSDDFENSICARNYKSADRSNRDVILIFSFVTEPGKGESRRTNACTTLSSDLGEKSYVCEMGKRYFYVAHYQRGIGNGNRIWVEEIPAAQLDKMMKINHEDYRLSLKKRHGQFELKPEDYLRNKEFLTLIK